MNRSFKMHHIVMNSCFDLVTKVVGRGRTLPDFIIIGAQKAGTTSLYHYLSQHPEIVLSARKELHYFDHSYQKGEYWYRGQFPSVRRNKAVKQIITGEATPNYIFHLRCPSRIRETVPDIKLIAVLRNPVDRAISHYSHVRRYAAEPLSMMEAFLQEQNRLAPEIERMRVDPYYKSTIHQYYSYLSRGKYLDQLERYRNVFPRDRLFLLKAEDLFSNPTMVLEEVYTFLGVSNFFVPDDLCPRNVGGYDRNAASKDVIRFLDDYFRPHNRRLNEYLGRDFGW